MLEWIVVPGVVVSAIGTVANAVWTYASKADLQRLDSRLRREEESFRLVHSPRVSSAVELWCAFCDFERWLRTSLSALRITSIPEDTPPENQRQAEQDALKKKEQTYAKEIQRTWMTLAAARDKAEVLLLANVFDKFEELFQAYDRAHSEDWVSRLILSVPGVPRSGKEIVETYRRIEGHLDEAKRLRPDVRDAIRMMIKGEAA